MNIFLRAAIVLVSFGLVGFCAYTSATATAAYPVGFVIAMLVADVLAIGSIFFALLSD